MALWPLQRCPLVTSSCLVALNNAPCEGQQQISARKRRNQQKTLKRKEQLLPVTPSEVAEEKAEEGRFWNILDAYKRRLAGGQELELPEGRLPSSSTSFCSYESLSGWLSVEDAARLRSSGVLQPLPVLLKDFQKHSHSPAGVHVPSPRGLVSMCAPNSGVWLLMGFRNSKQTCLKLFCCAERVCTKDLECVTLHQNDDGKLCRHDNSLNVFFSA